VDTVIQGTTQTGLGASIQCVPQDDGRLYLYITRDNGKPYSTIYVDPAEFLQSLINLYIRLATQNQQQVESANTQ
jgi:hypothetical protein